MQRPALLWLRAEHRASELRSPPTPEHAARLNGGALMWRGGAAITPALDDAVHSLSRNNAPGA